MHAGQNAHFGGQRANFVDAAAVHALAVVQQPAAHDVFLHFVHQQVHLGGICFVLKLGRNALANGGKAGIAHVFVVGVHGGLKVIQVAVAHPHQQVKVKVGNFKIPFGLANLVRHIVDEFNHMFDFDMRGFDGLEHRALVHLVRTRLNHDDFLLCRRHRQCQITDLALCFGGVDDQLPVHKAHKHACDGAVPRDVGDRQRNRRADHAGNFGAAVLVDAHDRHDHRHIVAHCFGEQRANGAVDDAAGQNGLFTGAAFAPHKAAGDTANRVQLLFKIDAEREKVDAFTRLFAHCHVAQHNSFAVPYHAAAVRQAAHFTGLHHKRAPGKRGLEHAVLREGFETRSKFFYHGGCLLLL